jgi:hypothetical protein
MTIGLLRILDVGFLFVCRIEPIRGLQGYRIHRLGIGRAALENLRGDPRRGRE